jgi:hypothetical protein
MRHRSGGAGPSAGLNKLAQACCRLHSTSFYCLNPASWLLPLLLLSPQYCTNWRHLKPLWFCIVSCHLLWFTFTKAMFNVLFKKITKKRVVFKSTKKKGEDDGRGGKKARKWCTPPANVGDMEGTLDAWVLVISFTFSFLTAAVGIFQMIDRPYTAQVSWLGMFLGSSLLSSILCNPGCPLTP